MRKPDSRRGVRLPYRGGNGNEAARSFSSVVRGVSRHGGAVCGLRNGNGRAVFVCGAGHAELVHPLQLQKIVQPLGVGRWQEASAALRALVTRVQQDRLSPEGFGRAVQQLGRQIMTSYRTMLDADTAEMNVLTDPWQYDCAESYLTAVRAWMERFTHRLLHEFDDYRNKQKIRDAVLYIQENYATPLNMALVSNEVDMNYSLFSLLFKQYVGTNFVAYLQGLRLTEAKRLLRETDLRVNEIGRRVGFTDDKNFLKVFKSAEGVSPTEYRRASQFGQ